MTGVEAIAALLLCVAIGLVAVSVAVVVLCGVLLRRWGLSWENVLWGF